MALRTPFVDLGDEHGPLGVADKMADPASGLPYLTAEDGAGLTSYPDIATAIADSANLVVGQQVIIQGGDNAGTGYTNEDAGIWQVTNAPVTVAGDFTKRLDVFDKAAEIEIFDANGWFGGQGVKVESALDQIGDKQVYYRLGDTTLEDLTVSGTSFDIDAIVSALVIDNGSQTDPDASGDSVTSGVVPNAKDAVPATPHRIPIRDNVSQDAIDDGQNNEVYAKLDHDSGAYVLKFYSRIAGVETAYDFTVAQDIDLAYVTVSQDFMKLPANTGIAEAFFYGDQGGVSGSISDEQVTTNSPAFQYFLGGGLVTQEQCNNKIDKLGSNANGEGASYVVIEAGGNFAATEVQGALDELYAKIEAHQIIRDFDNLAAAQAQAAIDQDWQINDVVAIAGDAGNEAERGLWKITSSAGAYPGADAGDYTQILDVSHTASEVGYDNGTSGLSATDVQAAIDELSTGLGNSKTTWDHTSLAAAAAAQGTDPQKIGDYVIIYNTSDHDEDGIYRVTAIGGVVGDYLKIYDAYNKASEVEYDNTTSGAAATDVQAAIDEIFAGIANSNGVHDYANLAAAQAAADATWLIGDYVIIEGDAGNEAERGIWKITAANGVNPGENPADYTQVLDISHTAAEVAYNNATSGLSATNVQAAVDELASDITASQHVHTYATISAAQAAQGADNQLVGDIVVIEGTAPSEDERGIYEVTAVTNDPGDYTKVLDISHTAAEVLIGNGGGGLFTGDQTQEALEELLAAIGGASTTVRDYSSNNYVTDNDDLVVAVGKLDAAIAAVSNNALVDTTYVAAEAIPVATSGPRLVSMTSTADNIEQANASDTGTNIEIVGFAFGGADLAATDPASVVSDGMLPGFTGLTPGAMYYADPTAEGGISTSVPSTVGQWVAPVGIAKNTTTLLVNIGEPAEIVNAQKALQVNIWFRDSSGNAGDGIGESGFNVYAGDMWVDNDATFQNPDKNTTGRYTVYACISDWTGTGADLTGGNGGDIDNHFKAIGKQN